jgi:ribosomal protein L12E/L44/L45/RPP1/RPP2
MTYTEPHDDDDNQEDEDPRQVTLSRDQIRSMERDARQARQLQRENAMLKAGIDTDSDLGTMFVKAYDGDLNPEVIRAAWAKIAPAEKPAEPKPDDGEPPAAEREGDKRFEEERHLLVASGSPDDGRPPDRDPRKTAVEAGQKALQEGKSRDEALAETFSALVAAAAAGDERAMWHPDRDR